MSTTNRAVGRTVAAVVALGFAGAGVVAAPAHAASTAPKKVAVSAAQYPRLIDNPLGSNDVIRFTSVPGAQWQLDGKDVTFASGRATADVKVTAASTATLAAVSGDEITWALPDASATSWTFPAPSSAAAPDVNVDAITPVWNDFPGTAKDTVTLPNVTGVVWTVTTGATVATYDADKFAGKPTVAVAATPATQLKAELAAGYTTAAGKSVPTFTNTITDTLEVAFTADTLKGLVSVGENPHDSAKGYGPGAAVETVKVSGVPGLRWKVGSLTAKVANGVTYLPVDPDDIVSGKVTITPIAARGYSVPEGFTTTVDFTDGTTPPTLVVTDKDVTTKDNGGTSADTLTLAPQQGMVWWVGQSDPKGRIVYAAQKPAKDGTVTYKVKHSGTGTANATVYLKPVPNRGFLLDTTKFLTSTYDFSRASTTVPVTNNTVAGSTVTLRPETGVLSWGVKYTATAGAKTVTTVKTVNPADISRIKATSMDVTLPSGATGVSVAVKLAKNYVLAK